MSTIGKYINTNAPTLPVGGGTGIGRYAGSGSAPTSAPPVDEDTSNDTNPILATGAGILHGLLEPISIVPGVHQIVENLKQYAGNSMGAKIGNGIGFLAGFAIPLAGEYKLAEGAVEAAMGARAIKVAATAEKAAELTRTGTLVRGALAGAMLGAGTYADDPVDYIKHIVGDAALGGVGDAVISSFQAARAARFGKGTNSKLDAVLDAGEHEQQTTNNGAAEVTEATERAQPTEPTVRPTDHAGIAAQARAMQLVDEIVRVKPTSDQSNALAALERRSPTLTNPVDQSFAEKRLGLKTGLSQIPWTDLQPGQMRIVPSVQGDAEDLRAILSQTPGIVSRVVKNAGETNVLVGMHDGFDEGVVKEFEQFGYMRGQKAIVKGEEYVIAKPAKNGAMIIRPGMVKAKYVTADQLNLLPIVNDISSKGVSSVAPKAAEFLNQWSMWPKELPNAATGDVVEAEHSGFRQAFDNFTQQNKIFGRDRIDLENYLVRIQKKSLIAEAPELETVLNNLEEAKSTSLAKTGPQSITTMAASRGLTYEKQSVNGQVRYVLKNGSTQSISVPMSLAETRTFLAKYQVAAPEMAGAGPLAEGVVPMGGSSTAMVPHTAMEAQQVPSSRLPRLWYSTAAVIPNEKAMRFAEDALIENGSPLRPWSNIFNPVNSAKTAFSNEQHIWLEGGQTADGVDIKGLLKIINPARSPIREEYKDAVTDLMQLPREQWAGAAKNMGLNDKEVEAAGGLRDLYNQLFDRHIKDANLDISADDFIENYFPHYAEKSDAEAAESLKASFILKHKPVNWQAADFASEMTRLGTLQKWQKDPFYVTLNYIRSGLYKSHMKDAIETAMTELRKYPVTDSYDRQLFNQVENYVKLSAYGTPESMLAVTNTFKSMGRIVNMDLNDKIINAFMSLNYGAFMAFRPASVIKNMTQTMITTYPMLGGKYTSLGLKMAASAIHDGFEEVYLANGLTKDHIPVPMGEELFDKVPTKVNGFVAKFFDGVKKFQDFGMTPFVKSENMNRAVAFYGQREKMNAAFTLWKTGAIDETAFFKKSGLNYFGTAVKQAFKEQGFTDGLEAGKWLGVHAANDTQWIYKLGAGPSLFSTGIGKIAGQYGTWPSWYAGYLAQGAKNLEGAERAVWVARNLAVHSAILYGGAEAGLNLARWTGLGSFNWMGGPAVDLAVDIRDVWGGVDGSGQSSPLRDMKLKKHGLTDDGEGVGGLVPAAIGGRIGIDPNHPTKFGLGIVSAFTPGYLAMKDMLAVGALAQDGKTPEATAKMLGLPLNTFGYEAPAITIK